MMKSVIAKFKYVLLVLILPSIYGCGGGGIGEIASFLFGGGGLGFGGGALPFIEGGHIAGAGEVAKIVQPEPASMLLLGSGLMAMGYFKSKTGQKRK